MLLQSLSSLHEVHDAGGDGGGDGDDVEEVELLDALELLDELLITVRHLSASHWHPLVNCQLRLKTLVRFHSRDLFCPVVVHNQDWHYKYKKWQSCVKANCL